MTGKVQWWLIPVSTRCRIAATLKGGAIWVNGLETYGLRSLQQGVLAAMTSIIGVLQDADPILVAVIAFVVILIALRITYYFQEKRPKPQIGYVICMVAEILNSFEISTKVITLKR